MNINVNKINLNYRLLKNTISVIIVIEDTIKYKGKNKDIHLIQMKICDVANSLIYISTLYRHKLPIIPKTKIFLIIEALHRIYDALEQCLLPNKLIISPFDLLNSELHNLIAVTYDACKEANIDYDDLRKGIEHHE